MPLFLSQLSEIFQNRDRVPSLRLQPWEPTQMPSFFSYIQIYIFISLDTLQGHWLETDNRIIFWQHHQGVDFNLSYFLICYREFIEDLFCWWIVQDFWSQMSVKFVQILSLFNLFHINYSSLWPEIHLFMFSHCLVNISLDKELLVDTGHVVNHFSHIQGWSQSHESSDLCKRTLPDEISKKIISSETCAHHVYRWIWITANNGIQGYFQIWKAHSSERHWASHLIVDSSAI